MRKFALRGLIVLAAPLVLATIVGCPPAPEPTTQTNTKIHDVGWVGMTRDFNTALAFKGHRVRIRIEANEYTIVGLEIHIPANLTGTKPIVIIKGLDQVPRANTQPITIIGISQGPTRDGVWRTASADFFVQIDEATAH